MPIKLQKAKISLSANKKNKLTGPASSLVRALRNFEDTPPKTAEGYIAFSDEDTTARYIRLQSKGLNILRSEIVAITEFIPLAVGDDQNLSTNKLKYELGNNKQVSMTNVARLIELHRQIRDYVITAAEAVLTKMYPSIYTPDFIVQLKSVVRNNFESAASENISETVKKLMIAVKETTTGDFGTVVSENANNPFLLATIEYFVYENLINSIITYLGRVAQIDEEAAKNWSIENFYNLKKYSPADTFANATLQDIYMNGGSTALDDGPQIKKNLLGFYKDGSNSDTDVFANAISQLVSLISLKDSASVLSTLSTADDGVLEIDPGDIRYGLSGDLADAIDALKDITMHGMAVGLPSGTSKDKRAIGSINPASTEKVTMSKLTSIFSSIETADGEAPGDITEGINELLTAMSFDFMTYICCMNNVAGKLSDLGGTGLGKNDPKVLKNYLDTALGADVDDIQHVKNSAVEASRDGIPAGSNSSKSGFGNFGTPLVKIRESKNSASDVFYAPLESTKKEVASNGQGYMTSTQYFIESSIEKSGTDSSGNVDVSFEELSDFLKQYNSASKKLHTDILTLLPDTRLKGSSNAKPLKKLSFLGANSPLTHLEFLNRRLANDIKKIREHGISNTRSLVPPLAVFINDASDSRKIKNFLSVFWAAIQRYAISRKTDDITAKDSGFGILAKSVIFSSRKVEKSIETMASMVEYYNETAVHEFLKDTCNLSLRSGGVGKRKFHASGTKFTAVMAEDGNVTPANGSGVKGKLPTNKPLNSDAIDLPTSNLRSVTAKAKAIDNLFVRTFGDGDKHQNIRYYRRSGKNNRYGFYRIFPSSLQAVLFGEANQGTLSAVGKSGELPWYVNDGVANNETTRVFERNSQDDMRMIKHPGKLGSLCEFSMQHRALIWISYVHNLLRKTVQVFARTTSNGELKLKIDFDQLEGLEMALRGSARPTTGESKQASYDAASSIIQDLYEKVEIRQSKIRDCAALFTLHADALKEVKKKANDVLSGKVLEGGVSKLDPKTSLAINAMKELNIFVDALTLNNDEAPVMMTQSFQKNFQTSDNSLLPRDIFFHQKKTQFMFKYMSSPGYGFLEKEKRGNKSVLNVGIPNSMLSALQINAFEETDDVRFLSSPYVCISVFKKSHLYPGYSFYPKNYIFDTSANILDYSPVSGKFSNHLLNYRGDASFDQLLQSMEISRIKVDENGKVSTRVSKGYGPGASRGIYDRDVLINHVTDYVLKEYYKLTTGLNFDEDSFLLIDSPLNFNNIVPSQFLGESLSEEYIRILDMIKNLYPETETDSQLKSEVFRLTKIIKQAAPFSFTNRFKKVITPKSFDKVYSILVNEKDFILNTSEDIFTSPVEFNVNSKIQRPDKMKPVYENRVYSSILSTQINRQKTVESQYAKSLQENYPEVYNYSVSVSLLPVNFEDGAELKPPLSKTQDLASGNFELKKIKIESSGLLSALSKFK